MRPPQSMKQHVTFKQAFAKKIRFLLVVVGIVSVVATPTYASIDFSIVSSSITTNSVVIQFRNNIESAVGSQGEYLDSIIVDIRIVRKSDSVVVQRIGSFASHRKETRNIPVTNLSPGTLYEAVATATQGIQTKESISRFQTTGTAPAPKTLPLAFDKSKTIAKNGTLKLFIQSSSPDKTFLAKVTVKNTNTGLVVGIANTPVQPGGTESVVFTAGIIDTSVYDALLTATPSGATTQYDPVYYTGIVIEPATGTSPPSPSPDTPPSPSPEEKKLSSSAECTDGIDNDGDAKADRYGVNNPDGSTLYEPDPSCFSPSAKTEKKDDVAEGSLIPCTDKCTFSDVFRLINNAFLFFVQKLLLPIFLILIMWAGARYILAGANSGKKADLKKLFGNMVLGIVLMLCAWLIVRTILVLLGYTEGLLFFE